MNRIKVTLGRVKKMNNEELIELMQELENIKCFIDMKKSKESKVRLDRLISKARAKLS